MLHGECVEHPEDGGNPPNRAGDVKAEEALQLGGAPMTPVASVTPTIGDTPCGSEGERERGE
jgi:hypothetical protein